MRGISRGSGQLTRDFRLASQTFHSRYFHFHLSRSLKKRKTCLEPHRKILFILCSKTLARRNSQKFGISLQHHYYHYYYCHDWQNIATKYRYTHTRSVIGALTAVGPLPRQVKENILSQYLRIFLYYIIRLDNEIGNVIKRMRLRGIYYPIPGTRYPIYSFSKRVMEIVLFVLPRPR